MTVVTELSIVSNVTEQLTAGDGRAALAVLQEELVKRGCETALVEPDDGRKPWLEVRNPEVEQLVERIVANANGFWWPWAERIARLDEVSSAAELIAQVLSSSP